MKALYHNRLCNVVEMSTDITLADEAGQFVVWLGDEALVIDPTDQQVADADNLREWYGLDAEAVDRFRGLLRGAVSSKASAEGDVLS
ncbi:MAG: hypothetical protein IT177_21585 [Acidobacteria bacterium]|nr:hypothetical protein [Acidobacteriota bacterium]